MSNTKTRSVPEQAAPTAAAPAPKPVNARRRRPALIGLSVALIAVGGLIGAMTLTAAGQREDVLVVAKPLAFGQVITRGDLAVASISLDPALKPVGAGRLDSIIGKHASAQLLPGTTLTQADVTSDSLVQPGQQLVGLLVKPGQLPTTTLVPGEKVLIVSTPGQNPATDTGASAGAPSTLPAQVVRVGTADSSGNLTVDVSVDANAGATLAARASTGNIAIIVQSPSAVG
ncbi:SAF domain-containing protein [Streptacidiphilus jiangxiensis]|uniref:SAF domain-containing protein n=1 Tax=Streptacidiphilus jiangxiensis TaxID=235985 RepID=A0A1H8BFR5_STRJI|nr:SAF domain-containing protein [Streptacidiphilus jiangxiensis]SEM80717.1 SAF domain-containing protein [Streptacidiphilus jiangxiensis]